MNALILKEYNNFVYEDIPTPEFGCDEVLVEVRACGICGSDVHGMDGSTGRRQPPIVMGHEASGVIAETGANVTGFAAGDRVTFDSTVYCGECFFCRQGRINLCDNRQVLGVSCEDYRRQGAFAEYVAVPGHILYKLPESITFQEAAMVEALSIAVHAVGTTPVGRDDTAVVVGSGMIGLLIVQVLRAVGCGRIIAVDLDSGRLKLARKFGADEWLKSDESDAVREILKQTGGRGADVAFEAVGIAPTVQTAVSCLRKGGAATLVGNLRASVEIPLQYVVTREITLRGSCASCGEYETCLEMIAEGKVDVKALISATAPLAEGAEWFRRLYQREGGLMKVILRP